MPTTISTRRTNCPSESRRADLPFAMSLSSKRIVRVAGILSYAPGFAKGTASYEGCQNHVAIRPRANKISPKPTAVSNPLELP